jgi:SAM-dependent methyltransferase
VSGEHVCRFCQAPLSHIVIDLGMSPLSNGLIEPSHAADVEPVFPLRVFVCERCWLVQVPAFESRDRIFREYAYFSSYSTTWLEHARAYAGDVAGKLALSSSHLVVELASNDGYLLKEFRKRSIPVLGIEPARNVAREAEASGIPTIPEFFGAALARRLVSEGTTADLIVANNVLAHVPDVNDFVAGIALLLKPGGTATLEFPHLLRMLQRGEFDTIYHEHFSYLSFTTVEQIFRTHGLQLFDVEELTTHGGSLRIFAGHLDDASKTVSARATALKEREADWGISRLERYTAFTPRVEATKRGLLRFLIEMKTEGKTIAGYGAPGKGNTLLNYCGIRTDFLDYTVDRNTYKQGKFTPGTRIPIYPPEHIEKTKPDLVFILPWNLKDEIMKQNAFIRAWGGKFVVPIPEVTVYD